MTQLDANGHLPPINPAASDRVDKRLPWTIRWLLSAVAVVAVLIGVVRPIYLIADATFGGPYTRAFQESYIRIATEAHLIGRPEADVVRVLGSPTSVYELQEFHRPAPTRVYRYAPSWSRSGGFQVLCDAGVVKAVRAVLDEYD